ncbi:histidine kinase [Nostoc linckia z18]|uniref:histidine kinase n=2 Tax=Nostoc linckia TaxID=92942 RepID=A0A9Q5ZDJ4_NOSLI|nr:ATP-binding protein [Nostoc linckia]PHK44835.1 histidine kinase [Nostoc linckia z16]PHJ61394.1 histidine kinase [Nostoc linckia z1]PHJ64211.1 histidine kinase [Nostoc linckia z3]PHJ71840.1 histidine kinase [Nostoc linckia z2]PHJ79919.1 histidine kinase [Nostoc linckia z4]
MTPEQFIELAIVLPEPLLLVTNEGQVLATNQAVADMLKLRRQELQGKMLFDLVTEPASDIIKYLQACSTSRAMILGSLTLNRNDGQTLRCRTQGAVIQPWSPESSALILLRLENRNLASNNFLLLNQKIDQLAKEVQKRKQAELELQKANEELEIRVEERTTALQETLKELQLTQTQLIQAEKMSSLGQMVAGIAHEVNNPVSFIYGNLHHAYKYTQDLLKLVEIYQTICPNPPLEIQQQIEEIDLNFLIEDITKLFNSMTVGTQRIQDIVKSLRSFSRLDEAELKQVNIHEGIDSTLMILDHRLQAKDECPEIKVVKKYGQLPNVTCYPGQLNQVFMNILVNAIDALEKSALNGRWSAVNSQTTDNPQIQIITEVIDENSIMVTIADNGLGIDEQVSSKLFDPFFTTKPVGQGTGLGLFISYQIIVEKHGGKLSCFSTPGKGAEFVIKIPICS